MSAARISSMQRFKAMTKELQKQIRVDAIAELNNAADELVRLMTAAAPLGPTGNLRRSIRTQPGRNDTSVRVVAGGALTTVAARKGTAAPYDYSLGVEFGTEGAPAHPFFFTTYRARKKRIRGRLKRKIVANIKARSAG